MPLCPRLGSFAPTGSCGQRESQPLERLAFEKGWRHLLTSGKMEAKMQQTAERTAWKKGKRTGGGPAKPNSERRLVLNRVRSSSCPLRKQPVIPSASFAARMPQP